MTHSLSGALANTVPHRLTAGHYLSVCSEVLRTRHPESGELALLVEPNAGPGHATVLGLVMFGARHRPEKPRFAGGINAGVLARVGGRVRTWFAEMF